MDRTWRAKSPSAVRAVCLAFALLLALPLLLPQVGAPAGQADELDDEDIGPTGDFLPGFGSARGTGVRAGPSRSGFNFTTDFAVSLADYQNTVARGDSRGVSLGTILETAAGAFDEDGEYIPDNLRIDSRDEDAADGVSRNEFGTPAESPLTGAIGSQYVRATDDPFAEVETLMGVLGLDGVIEVEGGTSRATSGIVDEGLRESRGEATFDRVVLGGGAVVLEGLEWTALHRSGAEDVSDATFTLGGMEIGGNEVIPADASEQGADGIGEAIAAANEVLAELGISLEAPEQVANETTGQVGMTPLKLSIGPSEASRSVAGPLSDAIQPIREPLAEGLIEAESSFGAIFLLFDVAFGAFAGGGELLVEIGGARAVTGSQEFDNPFGDGAGGFGEGFGEVPDEPTPQTEEAPDLGGEADAGGTGDEVMGDGPSEAPAPSTDAPSEPDEPVDEPVASEPPQQGEADDQDELAAPAGSSGPRGGQALTAALVALLVAAGLGGADFLRLRQSQRTIPV